jgi:hypothetical protein
MEATDFYKKRNDRINRIDNVNIDHLTEKPVAVIIGNTDIFRFSNQLMAVVSLNLLSRWNSMITIELDPTIECCLPIYSETTLKQVLQNVVSANDPFGQFEFKDNIDLDKYEYIIIVGSDKRKFTSKSIWIDSYNWVSGISNICLNYDKPKIEIKNPCGPAFAACCGIGLLFKNYSESTSIGTITKWYSLYDFKSSISSFKLENPDIPIQEDLGNLYQIGCGAVGSSLDYLLSLIPLKGKIYIIDFDQVKFENLSSSLIFCYKDAANEINKVEACKRYLIQNRQLEVADFPSDYSSFIKGMDYSNAHYPDTILCLANEKNVWATIQNNLPPVVYHATTSTNWVINFGRHIPQRDWCIVCRFGITDYSFTPKCSTGIITDNKERAETHLGTLPFLAPTAATIVLSELIKKNSCKEYPFIPENFIQYSMNFENMNEFMLIKQNKNATCPVCKQQSLSDYPDHFKKKFEHMI